MASTDEDIQEDLIALSIIERVGSALSLIGCLFVILTFWASKSFRKPINRLVFFASLGNLMTTVSTLMATAFLKHPNSVGCQLQAFLIQMFMPADAFWTLAMAVNVYLTFYHKYDASRLRGLEFGYFLFCYGVPFVPALTYIFIKNKEGQRMYGDATLWCWVTPEWDIMRIATFYAPVWVIMAATIIIYLRAGRTIYEKRNQLRKVSSQPDTDTAVAVVDLGTIKTTEVSVTTEIMDEPTAILGISSPMTLATDPTNNAYSITISSRAAAAGPARPSTATAVDVPVPPRVRSHHSHSRRRVNDLNNAAWAYTKCALLFFLAILVTWIPSSANRVFSALNDGDRSLPLEYMSAFVLPLQGLWNAVIYCVTSWQAVKALFASVRAKIRHWRQGAGPEERVGGYPLPSRLGSGRTVNRFRSESVTEFAKTRSSSNERLG